MATDAQSLLQQATCYQCFAANPNALRLIKLALLRQDLLARNPNAVTDAQTLLQQATCYQCYAANPYTLQLIELALLQQIVQAGPGGGGAVGGTGTCGHFNGAVPNYTPTGGCGWAIDLDGANRLWWYYNGAWH